MNKHEMREAAIERIRHVVKHQPRGPLCTDDVTEALVGDGWAESSAEEDAETIIELLTDDEPFLLPDDIVPYLGDEFAKGPRDADGILWFSGDMSDSEWGVIEGVFYDCTQSEWLVRGHDLTAPWVPANSIRHAPMRTATQQEDDLIKLPVDMDGLALHVGDKVTVDGHYDKALVVVGMTYAQEHVLDLDRMTFQPEGKWEIVVRSAECLNGNDYMKWPRFYFAPEKLRRNYEPTVEDILSEFVEDVLDAEDGIDVNEVIEGYAKRLQVRKEGSDGRG